MQERTLRLKEERLRKGISLWQLAMRTGIHPSNLSRIERGLFPAYPGWRRRIAEALGIEGDADWLFEEVADDDEAASKRC